MPVPSLVGELVVLLGVIQLQEFIKIFLRSADKNGRVQLHLMWGGVYLLRLRIMERQ